MAGNSNNQSQFTEYEIRAMCLAIPARIVELKGDNAVVDAIGNRYKAKTTLLPESKLEDLVVVHGGFAISLVGEEEAKTTWQVVGESGAFNNPAKQNSG